MICGVRRVTEGQVRLAVDARPALRRLGVVRGVRRGPGRAPTSLAHPLRVGGGGQHAAQRRDARFARVTPLPPLGLTR